MPEDHRKSKVSVLVDENDGMVTQITDSVPRGEVVGFLRDAFIVARGNPSLQFGVFNDMCR